jgi:hypothetical protein
MQRGNQSLRDFLLVPRQHRFDPYEAPRAAKGFIGTSSLSSILCIAYVRVFMTEYIKPLLRFSTEMPGV